MFITQAAAIRELKKHTGLSEATCVDAVKRMPKRRDGCRDKVADYDVRQLIAFTNDVRQAASGPQVRLSGRTKKRIRAGAIV